MQDVILRPIAETDRDWLVDLHSSHYAITDGFDETFGALVAEIVDAFLSAHDPGCEAGWIATRGTERLGCIFCVRLDPETAKLRLFLVVREARGMGLGRRLLKQCTDYARGAGYRRIKLWTHESHTAACALYRASGWTLVSSTLVHSFGQDLVEQGWTRSLV
jgi:GNAT superfamily N-acetyltransferase